MTLEKLRGRLLLSMVFGALVFIGLSAYADFSAVIDGLGRFRWEYLPVILGLTTLNYGLRFLKWQFYLKTIGVEGFPARDSALVYFAGLGMVVTPGKVGEWLKSYLLREISGVPFSRSAPIILAERLTDGIALTLLAVAGLALFQVGWQVLLVVTLGALVFIALSRWRAGMEAVFKWAATKPLVGPRVHHLRSFYESTHELLSPVNLVVAVGLGLVSWFGECLALYFVFVGLGVAGSPLLLVQSSFILASSTIAGAALMTPGGLGVAEGGIVGLSQLLLDVSRSLAVSAAILIRLGTLWFGVAVGLVALLLITQRLGRRRLADLAEAKSR